MNRKKRDPVMELLSIVFLWILLTWLFGIIINVFSLQQFSSIAITLSAMISIFTPWFLAKKNRKKSAGKQNPQIFEQLEFIGKPSAIVEQELDRIDKMDGHDFEYWCAGLLAASGFHDVDVTKKSGDQGVDIIAYRGGKKYAIQCKRYGQKLGNKPVQEIHTGKTIYHCDVAAVMTNNYFTAGAVEAAAACGVLLWDRPVLLKMLFQSA